MMRAIPPVLLLMFGLATVARAVPVLPPADPGGQCRAAIAAAERSFGIPSGLMAAIGVVESGRPGPDGHLTPWPWSINAEGTDHVFATRQAAIDAVRALQARGVRSIDVGCMQVNLLHHPDAFASLDAAFDPVGNVAYAARFLLHLHAQAGAWPAAAALYHSATPALAAAYQRKVMAAWTGAPPLPATSLATLPAGAFPLRAVGGIGVGGFAAPMIRRMATILPPGPTGRGLAAYRAAPVRVAAPLFTPPRPRGTS